jgi:hypothetical protein
MGQIERERNEDRGADILGAQSEKVCMGSMRRNSAFLPGGWKIELVAA